MNNDVKNDKDIEHFFSELITRIEHSEERMFTNLKGYVDERLYKSHVSRNVTDSELFRSLELRIRECIREEVSDLRKEVKPVMEWFKHMTWIKKVVLWIFVFIGTVSGAIMAVRDLYKKFIH